MTQDLVQLRMLKLLRAIQSDMKAAKINNGDTGNRGPARRNRNKKLQMMQRLHVVPHASISGPMEGVIILLQITPAKIPATKRTQPSRHAKVVPAPFVWPSNDWRRQDETIR